MLFYRSAVPATSISVSATRIISLLALIAYPVGAWLLHGSESGLQSLLGYSMVLTALICAASLIKCSLQRIVVEVPSKLDEFELGLRNRAMNVSYETFTGIMLLGIVYGALAIDHAIWIPATYEDFNGLFWGVFLYAAVIPVAVLSWLVDDSIGCRQIYGEDTKI